MTIAVLGLGGAGGNIANEAAQLGIHAAAINFSQRDLNSAANVRYKLKVPGSEGVGHDRELAIHLMQDHYDMVLQFVVEHFGSPSYRVVFVPFATGGGSGAGMAPVLIDIMVATLPDKVFVAVPVLPAPSEFATSQSNCSATMAELLKVGVCVLPVDNGKVSADSGKNKVYEETNTQAANFFFDLLSYTDRESRNGNFDRTDLVTLFRQKGVATIAEVEITRLPKVDLSTEGVAKRIADSWDSSIFATPEYSHVTKAAIIFDGQEALMGCVDPSRIFATFAAGRPLDLFEGYYHDNTGRIMTVLTGLPFPKTRFEQIDQLIEEGTRAAESVERASEVDYQPKLVLAGQSHQKPAQGVSGASTKQGVADILSRYRR